MKATYASSGVNIAEADKLVRHIKKAVRSTYTKGVLSEIGAFGGFFDARFSGYRSPVLVASVDGVGTKLTVAQMVNRHNTVGQDLVNHCVNDILVCGARPLFFMDYLATGKLKRGVAQQIIKGFAEACRQNGCALIGGETAEMPGMYAEDEYDLAGTVVGVVERSEIVDGKKVKKGDVLLGLPSTGLHTNGYSLARAVLLERFRPSDYVDELGSTLGDALLKVHRSYLSVLGPVLRKFDVHALSHITGGGIVGNTMRVMPPGRRLKIDWGAWKRPAIFELIQQLGEVPEADMRRTFNLGVGLIIVLKKQTADSVLRSLRQKGEYAQIIGEVV